MRGNGDSLRRDLEADALVTAAAGRRRRRAARTVAAASALVVTGLLFWQPRSRSGEPSPAAGPPSSERPVVDTRAPADSGVEILESDEALLAALEEQGPVISTAPDGTKVLILTRPR